MTQESASEAEGERHSDDATYHWTNIGTTCMQHGLAKRQVARREPRLRATGQGGGVSGEPDTHRGRHCQRANWPR